LRRLKIILQCKWLYYIFLIVSILYAFFITKQPISSCYFGNEKEFIGVVSLVEMESNKVNIRIRSKENLRGTYFLDDNEEILFKIGDIVKINGSLNKANHNTVPNLFDYHDYLKSKGETWLLRIDSIEKIGESNNFLDIIKRWSYEKINSYQSSNYLKVFLLGDQTELSDNVIDSYRENGISHLFSISGMHLSFLSSILLVFISKIFNSKQLSSMIVSIILLGYMFFVGCSASVVRAAIFLFLRSLFKLFKIKIDVIYIFYLMVSLVLFVKPGFILDIGFQYSSIICFFLLISKFNNSNYIVSIFKVSLLSFFGSLPISLYNFYQTNFLGIIYNLLFVPYVSFIVFPLSFLTFLIPWLDSLFFLITNMMENISLSLANISLFKMIFMKPEFWWIFLYYIFIFVFIKFRKKLFLGVLLILVGLLYFYPYFSLYEEVLIIDVGQGDSILMVSSGKNILIDTGGKISKYSSNSISDNSLIPLFKSKGIRKLDYLILTHGDYDHMGEAINLVENFKVEKVIFNCGEFNELEQELINVLDKKKINYYSCIKELNIDRNKLYFLQTKEYDNENDNSNVIYTELNGYKFMFMGDASNITEKEIIDKYNLPDIDVLKVGHHGSRTSSSKDFIDEINPKYSIISAGKNNRYGHPNKEVLDTLEKSKIYRTDQDGSVMFKIKNNNLKMETCAP